MKILLKSGKTNRKKNWKKSRMKSRMSMKILIRNPMNYYLKKNGYTNLMNMKNPNRNCFSMEQNTLMDYWMESLPCWELCLPENCFLQHSSCSDMNSELDYYVQRRNYYKHCFLTYCCSC
jgi:hypothetical protein